jgi:uncharacterized protein
MSYAIDANLLLYASDSGSEHFARAAQFLKECLAAEEVIYLPWPTIMAYLRIATHPRIFEQPLSPEEARRNIAALLDQPLVRPLGEGKDFWRGVVELSVEVPARGNLVPDLHIAALLKSNGIRRLFSRDRDFRKFDCLVVKDPLR